MVGSRCSTSAAAVTASIAAAVTTFFAAKVSEQLGQQTRSFATAVTSAVAGSNFAATGRSFAATSGCNFAARVTSAALFVREQLRQQSAAALLATSRVTCVDFAATFRCNFATACRCFATASWLSTSASRLVVTEQATTEFLAARRSFATASGFCTTASRSFAAAVTNGCFATACWLATVAAEQLVATLKQTAARFFATACWCFAAACWFYVTTTRAVTVICWCIAAARRAATAFNAKHPIQKIESKALATN